MWVFFEDYKLILKGKGLLLLRVIKIWHLQTKINLSLDLIEGAMLLTSFSETCLFLCAIMIPILHLSLPGSYPQIK